MIDPEFAFYGPMGFDIGAVIGNLLMGYFSEGHERTPGERREYEAWILETAEEVWGGFRSKFLELWRSQAKGDAYPRTCFQVRPARSGWRSSGRLISTVCSATASDSRPQK